MDKLKKETTEIDAEKQRIVEAPKKSVFDYFGQFDQVVSFLRKLTAVLVVLLVLCGAGTFYLYTELSARSRSLEHTAHTLAMFVQQRDLTTVWTFGTRLAADYYSMSYINAEDVVSNLVIYINARANSEVRRELEDYAEFLQQGQIIQTPENIQYRNIGIEEVEEFHGLKQFFITIPMSVRFQKAGTPAINSIDFVFGIYAVQVDKTLLNPFGYEIVNFGKIQ